MSTSTPAKKVVKLRGMEISILNSEEVIVSQNNHDTKIHLDAVLLPEHVLLMDYPQYTIEIVTFMETKPRPFIGPQGQSAAMEEALMDILKVRKKLRDLSKGSAIEKLPFHVEPEGDSPHFKVSTKHLEKGELVLNFIAFKNVYRSEDPLYLDPLVAKTLFALSLKTIYKVVEKGSRAIAGRSSVIGNVDVRLMRRITPNLIDKYIAPELYEAVRNESPEFHKILVSGNLSLKMTPRYIFDFVGGKYDTREYVSEVWEEAALNPDKRY